MDVPETVAEAVRLLESDGYSGEFYLDAMMVHCGVCTRAHEPAQIKINRTFRFEGVTDPGDEAIVLGLECPDCGARGVLVSAYGPDADAALLALVEHLGK